MHEHGEGVAKDAAEALRWYRLAADQGHPGACDKVARFFDAGMGVAACRGEAVRWFKRAVAGGFEPAESELKRLGAEVALVSDKPSKPPAAAAPADSTSRTDASCSEQAAPAPSPRVSAKAAAVQPIASAKAAAAKPVAVVAHRSSARAQSSSQQRGQAARQQLSDDA